MDLKELAASGSQRHPWELARAEFFCRLLVEHVLVGRVGRILDAGAGDAFFATRLAAHVAAGTEIVCVDLHYDAERLAALSARVPPAVRLSRELPDVRADVVLLLDVLEHIEDDSGYLRTLVDRSLAPGGKVLISVPAWPSLFSEHDRMLAHHRRYTPGAARALIEESGLRVLRSGGAFHALLPLRAAQLLWAASRRTPDGSVVGSETAPTELARWGGGPLLTRWVLRGLRLDNLLSKWSASRGIELPGLSFFALCEKRADRT